MGGSDSKPQAPAGPPPPDMNEILIGMKMKSKMFTRQSNKALKEKDQYYGRAKKELSKGNEEGAKMFLELANTKQAEYMQFMRMGVRLETLAVKLKGNQNSVEMMNQLNALTPVLQMESANMPLEQMYTKLGAFNDAYDDLTVKGTILGDGMEKTLGEKGGFQNVDNMMNGLKMEVAQEMGVPMDQVSPDANQQMDVQANTNNNDFYNNLKAM